MRLSLGPNEGRLPGKVSRSFYWLWHLGHRARPGCLCAGPTHVQCVHGLSPSSPTPRLLSKPLSLECGQILQTPGSSRLCQQHRERKHSFTEVLLLTFHSLSYYYLPASRFSLWSFSVGRVRDTTFGHIPGPPLTCGDGAAGALLPQPGFQRYCPTPHLSENRNQSHTLLSWEDGLSSSPASQEGRSAEGALVHAQSPPSPHLQQVRFLKSTEPRARHSLFCKAAPSQPRVPDPVSASAAGAGQSREGGPAARHSRCV